MTNEIVLAPAPELVRYLSILRRSLVCIHAWGISGDRDGMLLGGLLADALHNVPTMLLYYNPHASWHSPSEIARWLEHGFASQMRYYGAPPYLLAAYDGILSPQHAALELGLEDADGELDLASDTEMQHYLQMVKNAFLTLRGISNNLPDNPQEEPWWPVVSRNGSTEADEDGRFCAILAGVLVAIPGGLVRWGGFHKEKFHQVVVAKSEELVRDKDRKHWRSFFGITGTSDQRS